MRQRVLVPVGHAAQAEGIVVAVDPPTDLPSDTIPHAERKAIDRSHFIVQFNNGDLLDGSNTRIISGRHLWFPNLPLITPTQVG
jgi:hypothetical protein